MLRKSTLLRVLSISILFPGLLTSGVLPIAKAELPPGSYDKLRKGAGEMLVIEIIGVKQRTVPNYQIEVTLQAKVLKVEQSLTGLKPGAEVVISYTERDLVNRPLSAGPPPTGARPVPILERGSVYPAFLNRASNGKSYEPAAYGESFRMMPEG
jgi:hypothetical protein